MWQADVWTTSSYNPLGPILKYRQYHTFLPMAKIGIEGFIYYLKMGLDKVDHDHEIGIECGIKQIDKMPDDPIIMRVGLGAGIPLIQNGEYI